MLFCILLHFFLLFSVQVSALPLRARQTTGQPTSVTTVQTINSASGPVTETCVIVLTPITDAQGNDAVREVKTCTVSTSPSLSTSQTLSSPSITLPTSSPSSINPTSSSAPATIVPSSSVSISTSTSLSVASVPPTSASMPTTSATVSTTLVTVPTTSIAVPTASASVPASVSSAPTSPTPVKSASSAAPTSVGVSEPDTPTSSGSLSGTAAAEQATASNTAFTLPGRKLSVLPIGLGVFAGISVIALIVVGLVTYERTKYRRAFRQRRLAESGASLGYGGSAV